ncbi:hypothetical protein MBLNU459_g6050t1 [Dothideomycetes sp. NU459]
MTADKARHGLKLFPSDRSSSLDAVLARAAANGEHERERERELEREDERERERQHEREIERPPQEQQSVPPSPTTLTSPLSPAPSFSWPKRVRSPEPYVPLRKASPERLHARKAPPHPLFVTTTAGSQGFGPGTGRTAASPHPVQIHATAAATASSSSSSSITTAANASRDADWEHIAAQRYEYGGEDPHGDDGHAHDRHTHRRHTHDRHTHDSHAAQTSDGDAEGTRNVSWPLSPARDTFGLETLSSRRYNPNPTPNPGFSKSAHSVVDGSRGARDTHDRPSNGLGRASPSLREAPSVPEHVLEEVRTSFRSALTSNSSHMSSTVGTERSSIVTADSSMSEYVKIDASWADTTGGDDNFTVDDALDMYLGGFGTPAHSAKPSLDVRRESFPRASVDSSSLRPHLPPPAGGRPGLSAHRRSHSAGFLDRLKLSETLDLPLPRPGAATHVRTSTQIIAGRDIPTAPPSQAASSIASVKPVPRDRYGFKKVSHYITLEQYEAWERPYNEHVERRTAKWIGLMKQYGLSTDKPTRFPGKSEKVKRYIRKGIPPDWRGAAWFWYSGGPGRLAKDPGLYWSLLQQVHHGKLGDTDREHIERDLNRTFPDNVRFKPDPTTVEAQQAQVSGDGSDQPETSMVRSLRRVLQAFAVHNPGIGYCQSLNFIAGLLLLFLDEDEEKAFVLLNVVTSEHLPGTHGVALEGANIDIAVLMASIKESLPAVWSKLDDNVTTPGAPARLPTVSLATTAWFMSLFVGTLPIESVLRVWDCLFFEGSKTLFRAALAIFKAGESQIKAISDPMEIFQVVQSMPRGMIDANTLMECCFRKRNGFGTLSQDVVEKRREERRVAAREGRSMTDEGLKKNKLGRTIGTVRFKSKMRGGGG